mgnify:CR=1 FL=1
MTSRSAKKSGSAAVSTQDAASGTATIWHDPRWRQQLRRNLLRWFAQHARELPWRSDPTPYHVWVSEIMLQQTQVATVLGYYQRFLATYPTIADLAAADEQELMRLWEGLGYYRRARSLQAAAKQIVEKHDGVFPRTYEDTLALPGIGRYTAGAILSISGDQRLPILEGNTVRVYSRWTGLREPVAAPATKETLWEIATAMLPRQRSGRFNQAAMELGALVCKPKSPQCDHCCVRTSCQAYALGLQDVIPGKVTSLDYQPRQEYAFVVPITDSDAVLLCRVPSGQRWAGLWDFPRWTEDHLPTVQHAAAALSQRVGCEIQPLTPQQPLATIRHTVTRYRITLQVHRAAPIRATSISLPSDDYRLVRPGQWEEVPLSVTGRKIAALVQSPIATRDTA